MLEAEGIYTHARRQERRHKHTRTHFTPQSEVIGYEWFEGEIVATIKPPLHHESRVLEPLLYQDPPSSRMPRPFHPASADSPTLFPDPMIITSTASSHRFIIAMLMTISLVNSSPLLDTLNGGVSSVDQRTTYVPNSDMEKQNNISDPRRIMCGYQLIVNLKMQCGDRGTFSPYERGPRIKRGLRLGKNREFTKLKLESDPC